MLGKGEKQTAVGPRAVAESAWAQGAAKHPCWESLILSGSCSMAKAAREQAGGTRRLAKPALPLLSNTAKPGDPKEYFTS